MEILDPGCAGLDLSKRDAKVWMQAVPIGKVRATEEITTWSSMTGAILALRDQLVAELDSPVTVVVTVLGRSLASKVVVVEVTDPDVSFRWRPARPTRTQSSRSIGSSARSFVSIVCPPKVRNRRKNYDDYVPGDTYSDTESGSDADS